MPQIYDMGPTALLPLRRKVCWGFFRPKNLTTSAGFEPANLGTKGQHATPRPPKASYSGKSLPKFRDNPLVPASRVRKSKRENRWRSKLTDTIFFFLDFVHSNFLQTHNILERWLCFGFQAKKHLTRWTRQNELFSITGHHRNSNLLRYVPENRLIPRVITGKWQLEN